MDKPVVTHKIKKRYNPKDKNILNSSSEQYIDKLFGFATFLTSSKDG